MLKVFGRETKVNYVFQKCDKRLILVIYKYFEEYMITNVIRKIREIRGKSIKF